MNTPIRFAIAIALLLALQTAASAGPTNCRPPAPTCNACKTKPPANTRL